MRMADLIGGVVVLLLGLAVVFFSSQLPYYSEYGPGPGFLPLWVGVVIVGCAMFVLVNVLRKHEKIGVFFKARTKLGLRVLAMIFITFLLLPLLGFSIGLGLFVGITMRIMGRHHWASCGLTSVVTAICIHLIFISWLTIPLPQGLIGW
ncbi:MAG: tripartite tricarboxylate transporter TctB family protein [Syntrophaceae bacterium]|nr:tripartite tricarboxylate transporter TctB family protein [Syntrophaceae bacterium]